MDKTKELSKTDIALVTCLYIVVIIIIALLVISISNQKKIVKDNLNNKRYVEVYDE